MSATLDSSKSAECNTVMRVKDTRVGLPRSLIGNGSFHFRHPMTSDFPDCDFRYVRNPVLQRRCAVALGQHSFNLPFQPENYLVPIGDPSESRNSFDITLSVYPGKHGEPFLYLIFRINEESPETLLTVCEKDCHSFTVVWCPGIVTTQGLPMIRNMKTTALTPVEQAKWLGQFPSTHDRGPKALPESSGNLTEITFNCEMALTTNVDESKWKHFDSNIRENLRQLCLGGRRQACQDLGSKRCLRNRLR